MPWLCKLSPWVEPLDFLHDTEEYSSLYEMRLDEGVDKYTQDNAYYCINRNAKRHETDKRMMGGEGKSAVSLRSARNHFFISSNIDTQAEESGSKSC